MKLSHLSEETFATMKARTYEGFGPRLAEIRKGRGVTQAGLGARVGVSQRVIAYYEDETAQPPGAMLADLAQALHVSVDELLGLKPVKAAVSPKAARLLNRLRRVEELPPADQRIVLGTLDALLAKNAGRRQQKRSRQAVGS